MDHATSAREPGPRPAAAPPHLGTGVPKSPGSPASAGGEGGGPKGSGAGSGDRRPGRPAGSPRPADPYSNDILPAKPASRFRFRFFLPFGRRR